jgi:TetR/AcrR family transcriptional regulator
MKDTNTEDRILQAAEEVFHEKGFEGARMQEIADNAKINKGLLHYYFKTKNKLFETIFSKAIGKMIVRIEDIMKGEQSFVDKIDSFIDNYLDLLMRNPYLPKFVVGELNRDPDRFVNSLVSKHDFKTRIGMYYKSHGEAVARGEIEDIDPNQLLINIISLCVFPFIGRPMIQGFLHIDNQSFKALIVERKVHVKQFVKKSIAKTI